MLETTSAARTGDEHRNRNRDRDRPAPPAPRAADPGTVGPGRVRRDRAGEAPLTLGQLDVYNWLSQAPDHFYAILRAELPVPDVVSVDDVAEATAVLIARYEGLRTSYVRGERPRQRVAAAGVQLLEVCSLGEGQWGPRDRPAVAEALGRWLRESPDPARRPLRIAVAIAPDAGDRVIACATAFSHLAVDHGSIRILKRDFAELLGDPDAVAPAVTRVFASAHGRPLVACLAAAAGDIRTPEQAHARCMAALPRHPTAITPRHYVICRTPPADPADPAAWPAPVAAGTGRAGTR